MPRRGRADQQVLPHRAIVATARHWRSNQADALVSSRYGALNGCQYSVSYRTSRPATNGVLRGLFAEGYRLSAGVFVVWRKLQFEQSGEIARSRRRRELDLFWHRHELHAYCPRCRWCD